MKRTRRKQSAAEKEAHAAFRDAVLRGGCIRAHTNGCSGHLDPHHIIRKGSLKVHTSTLPDAERWPIVHDPRNGVPLCHRHHEQVTNRVWPQSLSEVPDRAKDFAEEQGLTWLLEKECPTEGEVLFG